MNAKAHTEIVGAFNLAIGCPKSLRRDKDEYEMSLRRSQRQLILMTN